MFMMSSLTISRELWMQSSWLRTGPIMRRRALYWPTNLNGLILCMHAHFGDKYLHELIKILTEANYCTHTHIIIHTHIDIRIHTYMLTHTQFNVEANAKQYTYIDSRSFPCPAFQAWGSIETWKLTSMSLLWHRAGHSQTYTILGRLPVGLQVH